MVTRYEMLERLAKHVGDALVLTNLKGTAHEWTPDEARNAGRKGGQISRGGRGRLVVSAAADVNTVSGAPASGAEPRRAD